MDQRRCSDSNLQHVNLRREARQSADNGPTTTGTMQQHDSKVFKPAERSKWRSN